MRACPGPFLPLFASLVIAFVVPGVPSMHGQVASHSEAAENTSGVTVTVSGNYSVVQTETFVQGAAAFHLAHPTAPWSQRILLNPILAVGPETKLFFESKLGYATPSQTAKVQISTDGGTQWTDLWSRAGTNDAGQTSFEFVEVPLAAYQGQNVRVRFAYEFVGGSLYSQTDVYVGWILDDIQIGTAFVPQLYEIGEPTAKEQLMLEYINRARANATVEVQRLKTTTDPDVLAAISYFGVNLVLMEQQFAALTQALPPLAPNAKLMASARLHSQDMLTNGFQGHVSSSNPPAPNQPGDSMSDRVTRQGYDWQILGENVFAHAESPWHGHAAFNIDWGGNATTGGMQSPPGHRLSIHSGAYREIGIGVLEGSNGAFGPLFVTQDFGTQTDADLPFLTGVAYVDADGNGFYSEGEGIGGVTVTVSGTGWAAVTTNSGGYAVPLSGSGNFTVSFEKTGYIAQQWNVPASGGNNVKLDYLPQAAPLDLQTESVSMNGNALRLDVRVTNGPATLQLWESHDLQSWTQVTGVTPVDLGGGLFRFERIPLGARWFLQVRGTK